MTASRRPSRTVHAVTNADIEYLRWKDVRTRYPNLRPMEAAPRDGTPILIRFEHVNFRLAVGDDRFRWEELCQAHWIDFNHGGWTWHGIAGAPTGWMPLSERP